MTDLALLMFWGTLASGNLFFGIELLGKIDKEMKRKSIEWLSAQGR